MFKKLFSALILSSLIAFGAQAQFTVLGKSEQFSEQETGTINLMMNDEGKTHFLSIYDGKELTVKVFDESHKQIVNTKQNFQIGDHKYYETIKTTYLGNDIVLFLYISKDRVPMLQRIVVDGQNGNIKQNEIIGSLSKITNKEGLKIYFEGYSLPTFKVLVDEKSQSYCVVLYNSLSEDIKNKISVEYYNAQHQLTKKSTLLYTDKKVYEYFNLADAQLINNEVYLLSIGTTKGSKKVPPKSQLFISKLAPDQSEFQLKKINYPKPKDIINARILLNPTNKNINIFSLKEKLDGKYQLNVSTSNSDLDSFTTTPLNLSALTVSKKKLYGVTPTNSLIPQYIYLNNDGTYNIGLEEFVSLSRTRNSNMVNPGGTKVTFKTFYGDFYHLKIDENINITQTYIIPKQQDANTVQPRILTHNNKSSGTVLNRGKQYRSFDYLNTGKNSYLLINDLPENVEKRINKKKLTMVQTTDGVEAYAFNINQEEIPKGDVIIQSKQNNKETNKFIHGASFYHKGLNKYVVLNLNVSKNKQHELIWLQPQ